MIHFVCPVTNQEQYDGLLSNLEKHGRFFTITPVYGEKSITAAYNKGTTKETYGLDDIFCFIHQDARLHFPFDEVMPEYFLKLLKPGVLGFCGCDRITEDGRWWVSGNRYGGVVQFNPQELKMNLVFGKPERIVAGTHHTFQPVIAMDGYCLFIRCKTFFEIGRFSEEFFFHLYDTDICLKAIRFGYRNYVIDQLSQHFSPGDFTVDWTPIRQQFLQKWKGFLDEVNRSIGKVK